MIHKTRTKALSWLLALAMVVGLLPGISLTAYADGEVLHTFSGNFSYYQFQSTIVGDTNASKVTKIEALVWITGEPTWGLIQVANAGTIKQYVFSDNLRTGIHNYTWDIDNINYSESGDGQYAQVMMGANENYTGEMGRLLAYRVTYSDASTVSDEQEFLKTPVCVSPTSLTATYGQTLADVTLTNPTGNTEGTWTWADGNTSVGDVGTNTFSATFTPKNSSLHTVTNITVPVTVSAHAHNFTYSANGATITATCGADGCTLPEVGGKHTAKLTIKPPANLVYDNKAKAATVEGTIPDVETPSIKYIGRGDTTYESTDAPTEMGDYTASVTLTNVKTAQSENGTVTASVDFTIKDASYTIIIPATLTVANAGWNATAGITASGEIAEGTKLTVTAASANEWKLTKTGQQETIAYKLAESGDSTTTYAGATEKTVWDFSVDELLANEGNGTNKPMGAVVEEYINKPAGDYADTVTFTAEIRSLLNTITIDGTELIYADGDTWAQIVERNPEKIRIAGLSNNLIWLAQDNPLYIDGRTPVRPTDTIDPSLQYGFVAD